YVPDVVGFMNRTNELGAWAGGILMAASLVLLSRWNPMVEHIGFAVILAGFTWTNSFESLQWATAWRYEQDILRKVAPRVRELPRSAMVILTDTPIKVGGVPVFTESWDFEN